MPNYFTQTDSSETIHLHQSQSLINLGALFYTGLAIFLAFAGNFAMIYTEKGIGEWLLAVGFIVSSLCLMINISDRMRKPTDLFYILIPLFLILRFGWICLMPPVQRFDTDLYLSLATQYSQDNFNITSKDAEIIYTVPFKVGYPFLMSFIFRIFGAEQITALTVNLLADVGCLITLYFLARDLFNQRVALCTVILYTLFPTGIMYSMFVTYEHWYILFMLLMLMTALRGIKSDKEYLLGLSGVLGGITYLIKPTISPMIFLFLPYILLVSPFKEWKKKLKEVLFIILIFIFSCQIINFWVTSSTGVRIQDHSAAYSIMMGSSLISRGGVDDTLVDRLNPYLAYPQTANQIAKDIAAENWENNPSMKSVLIYWKFLIQWSDEHVTHYLCAYVDSDNPGKFQHFVFTFIKDFRCYVMTYYGIILALAFVGIFLGYSRQPWTVYFCLFLLFNIGMYFILEVTPRYRYSMTPLMMIFAGYTLSYFPKEQVNLDLGKLFKQTIPGFFRKADKSHLGQ